jgi:hypothetical protein
MTVEALMNGSKLDGFSYTLLERAGRLCLFRKDKPSAEPPHPPYHSFEVVVLQEQAPCTAQSGRQYPARLSMPPPEEWGTHGWTYNLEEDARAAFERRKGGMDGHTKPAIESDGGARCLDPRQSNPYFPTQP